MRNYTIALWVFLFVICNNYVLISSGSKQKILVLIKTPYAPNIITIRNDTIFLAAGLTCAFTVDTPEDKGIETTLISLEELGKQLQLQSGEAAIFKVTNSGGVIKNNEELETGDHLTVSTSDGKYEHKYFVQLKSVALSGRLGLVQKEITAGTTRDITLHFSAGQRSPNVTVQLFVPFGIEVNLDNVTVNVIGRGAVKLRDLELQSIGRTGNNYSYSKVGKVEVSKKVAAATLIKFSNLDLRPDNGIDLEITIKDVYLAKEGEYKFYVNYETSQPEKLKSAGIGQETATLVVENFISDMERMQDIKFPYKDEEKSYNEVKLKWTPIKGQSTLHVMQSMDNGATWDKAEAEVDTENGISKVTRLTTDKWYLFRLEMKNVKNKKLSNIVQYYSGKIHVKEFGIIADDSCDQTEQINKAIEYLHQLGGGTLLFSGGTYCVRTVHLKSNVYLYLENDATIKALKDADAPEPSWFSDKKYRSGLSPTDTGPYDDPENYLTKQDVGHTFFRNAMFFGERLDNVKIIGNGRITGDGNLVTGDKVMNNLPDNRADKMFSFKLCTNIEIGGIARDADLWYDPEKDEPYYIGKNGFKDFDCSNMLNIDRGGHFVLLATGTDNIFVHNSYFGKFNTSNVRDIYDFMGCNDVTVTNIYCKVSSDDIVKPGSDCSLGFTRPAKNYKVRNIIGDTNCNLFQIGSETADDITDVCVDNIYVLGANKAGFSISTNDGGHVKNIHLNCGHTGALHSRSKMYRTTTPFFISISNRGRVLGANVARYRFNENGNAYDELLCTNVNIGEVENIILNGIDVFEIYGGSSFRGDRWKTYDGTQRKASPIIAGYKLPDSGDTVGGLNFKLPNGTHTRYVTNISFNDIHILVKGGNTFADSENSPRELGVGQYNVSNLGIQPSYGLWARHAKDLCLENCSFNYEKRDSRFAIVLDDVVGAKIDSVKMIKAEDNDHVIKLLNSSDVSVRNTIYYRDEWGQFPSVLPSGAIETPFSP